MSEGHVLVVEDDMSLRVALCDTLELAGYSCTTADNGKTAVSLLSDSKPDVIVSDVQMDEMDGFELLNYTRQYVPDVPVILITAFANIDGAVSAMRDGAMDYLQKPFEPQLLVGKVNALKKQQSTIDEPVAEDPESQALLAMGARVAQSDATVLISGESGTGKEVLARYIHDHSQRSKSPFVAINCAAIPDNMLEATLFGYEKGAFTGAYKSTPGKFELAQGGTLLLDEISEMPLTLQAKLLRVLQEREVERLGGSKVIKLDVRILATTNRDLREEVEEGNFREDLFYRLNVFPLRWKPLNQRARDIIPLAEYIISNRVSTSTQQQPTLSQSAIDKLAAYNWPGNARELDNVIQRALILCHGDEIQADDIQLEEDNVLHIATSSQKQKKSDLESDLKNREQQVILSALRDGSSTRKEIADQLGISPRTLRYKLAKMREAGIEIPSAAGAEG